MSSRLERSHLGMITGMFMVAVFVLFNMSSDAVPALAEIRAASELYFIVIALATGFLLAQIFIWYYKKGIGGYRHAK